MENIRVVNAQEIENKARAGILASGGETPLATPGEMAKILRCSPPQILRLMRAGTIPVAFSVGRLHRFDPSAVLAALAAHKAAPGDAETPRGED